MKKSENHIFAFRALISPGRAHQSFLKYKKFNLLKYRILLSRRYGKCDRKNCKNTRAAEEPDNFAEVEKSDFFMNMDLAAGLFRVDGVACVLAMVSPLYVSRCNRKQVWSSCNEHAPYPLQERGDIIARYQQSP